jgi:hypothetical protein
MLLGPISRCLMLSHAIRCPPHLARPQVWGEDFILSSPALRKQLNAIALTYLDVLTIAQSDLFTIASIYSPAREPARMPPCFSSSGVPVQIFAPPHPRADIMLLHATRRRTPRSCVPANAARDLGCGGAPRTEAQAAAYGANAQQCGPQHLGRRS